MSDLLPNEGDGQELHKQAVQHIMCFLVEEFSSLTYLAALTAPEDNSSNESSFKDEKYKSETVDILDKLAVDAQLTGKPEVSVWSRVEHIHVHVHVYRQHGFLLLQILVGDQLTCKIMRGARESHITPKDGLD